MKGSEIRGFIIGLGLALGGANAAALAAPGDLPDRVPSTTLSAPPPQILRLDTESVRNALDPANVSASANDGRLRDFLRGVNGKSEGGPEANRDHPSAESGSAKAPPPVIFPDKGYLPARSI